MGAVKKDLEIKKEIEIERLKKMIDEHDCHLSPEDSCKCLEWRTRVYVLGGSLNSYPQND